MRLVIVGMISGVVTGLGMGGGSILILLLTMYFNVEQHVAQTMNLFFFIPTSITAIYVYFKNKNVETVVGKKLLWTMILGASGGAMLAQQVNTIRLKKYFGCFILVIACIDVVCSIHKNMKKRRESH